MSCPFRRDWKSPRGRGEAEENVAQDALDVVCKFIELAYKTLSTRPSASHGCGKYGIWRELDELEPV